MIIYPAIDLRHGRCVRLRQGDPNAETVFGEDPAAMACHWAEQGAEWLHVVNLDGALEATSATLPTADSIDDDYLASLPINLRCLYEIAQSIELPIQFGGGLRTLEDIELALALGAERVVLGTVAVKNPTIVTDAIAKWGQERIVVGLDARDGQVAIHGWQESSGIDVIELGQQMKEQGVQTVLYTDIARDGMLSGVNVEATARLGNSTGLEVIASGGVASIDDIEQLKARESENIVGVIVGQALYTDNLALPAAIEVGHRPLTRRSAGVVPY